MSELSASDMRRVYVDGGQTIQSFLQAGLIDEITIAFIPILLGAGKKLFPVLPKEQRLQHIQTEVFPSGVVQIRYVRNAGD